MAKRKPKAKPKPAPVYSVGTWDGLLNAFTPQQGLSVPSINVPLATMRQVLRELRQMGYDAQYRRDASGEHWDNDPVVMVERTDGKTDKEVLAGWRHIRVTVIK